MIDDDVVVAYLNFPSVHSSKGEEAVRILQDHSDMSPGVLSRDYPENWMVVDQAVEEAGRIPVGDRIAVEEQYRDGACSEGIAVVVVVAAQDDEVEAGSSVIDGVGACVVEEVGVVAEKDEVGKGMSLGCKDLFAGGIVAVVDDEDGGSRRLVAVEQWGRSSFHGSPTVGALLYCR